MDYDAENDHLLKSLGQATRQCLNEGRDAGYAELSSALEYLLGRHWADAGLVPAKEFDGLAHARITKRSADKLEVLGLMIDIETQYMEWFSARLSLWPGTGTLQSYWLRHGLEDMVPIPYDSSPGHFERGLLAISSWKWTREFKG